MKRKNNIMTAALISIALLTACSKQQPVKKPNTSMGLIQNSVENSTGAGSSVSLDISSSPESPLDELFKYIEVHNGVKITLYLGEETDLIIPDTLGGMPVISIDDGAFAGSAINSVTIPNSVSELGTRVFDYCTNLETVILGNNVSEISSGCFNNCTSLTNISIPDSVVKIDGWAFRGCTSLKEVTVPDNVTEIVYDAFLDCHDDLIVTYNGKTYDKKQIYDIYI